MIGAIPPEFFFPSGQACAIMATVGIISLPKVDERSGFSQMRYTENQKTEALKLVDEIGAKKASEQLSISYPTILDWRKKRAAAVASGVAVSGFAKGLLSQHDNPSLEMQVQLLQHENTLLKSQLTRQAKALHALSPVEE